MVPPQTLIEALLEFQPVGVQEAGARLLYELTAGAIDVETFLDNPDAASGAPHFVSRYLGQVALRALQERYESVDELIAGVQALVDREPPTLEAKRTPSENRVVLPEAKVLEVRPPARLADGSWESGVDVLVTSGPLRNREARIALSSGRNRFACFATSYLWTHAAISAYNLIPVSDSSFEACSETFFVIEPARQVNATAVARSLHCYKPQMDQLRRGKGDVTIHTLKGQLVHALFDRMLEGDDDMEQAYAEVLPQFLIALASITDEFFNEAAFKADVLRHMASLKSFVECNAQLRDNAQLELKRYSATIGIQGRIDALLRQGKRLEILELKTGKQIRPEDHAQLYIYKILLSDLVRKWSRTEGEPVEITARLLSSIDGSFSPLRAASDFYEVLDARNRLVSIQHSLSIGTFSTPLRYEGFDEAVCAACPSWTRKRCAEHSDVFGDRPDSVTTPDLDYFRRFTQLVQRERFQADQDLASLLDDSLIDLRVRNFRTIRAASIVPDAEPFTFEFERNTSDLERGDSVLIHAGNISSEVSYHGHVREISADRIRVAIPLKKLNCSAFEGRKWIVDRFPSDVTAEASHTALYDFLVLPPDKRKAAILGGDAERGPFQAESRELELDGLNPSQIRAVENSIRCDVFHLIWGPPGSGKTKVIPQIVRRTEGRVLLGAFTNTAVDKMLLSLLDSDSSARFVRFGRASDSPELRNRLCELGRDPADCFSEDLARKTGAASALRQALENVPVLAATAHRAATAPFFRTRSFEMAIVDEAGQLTEPLTLGLVLRARRFVLIGDDRQLPPVVRTPKLGNSMFERLKRQAERSGAQAITLLDTQYRMHPEIMEISNRLFYGGRLRSGVSAADRHPPGTSPVVFLPIDPVCDAETPESMKVGVRANVAEARVVHDLVCDFIRARRVRPEDIGVISPFRAQVVLIRRVLSDSGIATGVTVDTVERFQGGERDVMILSFVRSCGAGFVFDERRLNVAITRARRKLMLVGHPDLFRNTRYEWISTYIETPKTVGGI